MRNATASKVHLKAHGLVGWHNALMEAGEEGPGDVVPGNPAVKCCCCCTLAAPKLKSI